MLTVEMLNAEMVQKKFKDLQAMRPKIIEELPIHGYASMKVATLGILQLLPNSNMPSAFPVARATDDSEEDVKNETETETEPKTKTPRTEVVLEKIALAEYKKNEQAIKEGLRNNDAVIYTKYPAGKPIPATRFAAVTPFHVFVIPSYTGPVDFVYRQEDFPASFIGFQDKTGERWKCVAIWDGTKVIYMANINAEIRLCSLLYTGSSNGKVRWEKAVQPRNEIASNFSSFAVSDRVLLERRKQYWPEALKRLRESCQGAFPVITGEDAAPTPMAEKPKKIRAPKQLEDIVSGEAPPAKKRKIAETFYQVTVGGKNRLTYTVSAGDSIQVDEMSMVSGKKQAKNLFTL